MKHRALSLLEKALNKYLALDPESKRRYHALHGKPVTVELMGLGLTFQLQFTQDGVSVLAEDFQQPVTTIKGTPLRLAHIALTRENRQKFFDEDAVILGSAEVGQQVMDLFDHMEIDWEEHLSQWVGDVPAHHAGRLTRDLLSWGKKVKQALCLNMNEYIHEEIELFPPTEAIQDFFADVDTLRMDVDRLEARVDRLIQAKRGLS